MRRTATEVIRNLEQRIARLERQAGKVGKTCVIQEMYREGREGETGEAVLVCNGVRIAVSFDTLGYSTVTGNDSYLKSTGAMDILNSLKKEYRKPNIKEFIGEAVGVAGEERMTLDECIKLYDMFSL